MHLQSAAHILTRSQWLPRSRQEIFEFFSHPANLQTLTPPWLDFQITESPDELQAGSLIRYKLRTHGIPLRWTTEITEWQPPYRFVDTQLSGPYKLWHHEHTFTEEHGGTMIGDTVRYALPFGPLGNLVHWLMVRRDVNGIFDYREKKMLELFGEKTPL
jgi:hypothetical protein